MVEAGSVENIRVVGDEAGRVVKAGRVMVYRIAPVIEVTGKISENVVVEMIVWELTSFLNGEYRGFSAEMVVDHCMDFLKFLEFLELLVEVEMKVVVSGNFSLLMIHGVSV
jgi:hypothetical protein